MKFKLKEIDSIKKKHYKGVVHDLTVEKDHSYTIKGTVVHNSICSTRLQTGHGIPNLSAIQACYSVFMGNAGPSIILDGGVRTSGDIVKALAAGADFVMCGSLFAGTTESPGEIREVYDKDGRLFSVKTYRGMASREAQRAWKGNSSSPEGISETINYKGSIKPILEDLSFLTKTGLSYSGASTIKELREKAVFVKQTVAGVSEGQTHISNIAWKY